MENTREDAPERAGQAEAQAPAGEISQASESIDFRRYGEKWGTHQVRVAKTPARTPVQPTRVLPPVR